MERLVKLNNQTAGRDKIARLLQYLSRILWHRFQQQNKRCVNDLKNLEFQLSTFRKLLRFGRFVEGLHSSVRMLDHPDIVLRTTLTLSRFFNSLFLLFDHILWLGRANVFAVNTNRWSRLSNRFWVCAIASSLARDLYELQRVLRREQVFTKCVTHSVEATLANLVEIAKRNRGVVVDTLKNSCDIFIPLAALGHVNISAGTVGWLGAASSLAGLVTLIDVDLKLNP